MPGKPTSRHRLIIHGGKAICVKEPCDSNELGHLRRLANDPNITKENTLYKKTINIHRYLEKS